MSLTDPLLDEPRGRRLHDPDCGPEPCAVCLQAMMPEEDEDDDPTQEADPCRNSG